MKNTFLVLNDPENPKSGLRVATSAEWDRILKANKKLPREQRRFKICSVIILSFVQITGVKQFGG